VEETHRQSFPDNQTELDRIRREVEHLRVARKVKSEALDAVKKQVPEWMKTMEALQSSQLSVMFDLVPPLGTNKDSADQHNVTAMTTDDMWWGQQATDESEDL